MTMRSMITIALFLLPLGAAAEIGPVGSEFQVNTYTVASQDSPAVAAGAGGAFVVVWHSYEQDGDNYGVFAQRYGTAGEALGTEFQVSSSTLGGLWGPDVAADVDGAFVVAWEGPDGNNDGVFARRFDNAGQPLGTEFQVNSSAAGFQYGPSVTMRVNRGFVVAWSSSNAGSQSGVFGRRYDSAGQPDGAEFRINSYTMARTLDPAVAASADGAFVVAWESGGQDGSSYGVFAQRYDSAGAPVGTEFQVNTYTSVSQGSPAIAAGADGALVITWGSFPQDGDDVGVFGQRYDSTGQAVGTEFQVSSYTTGSQNRQQVALGADGTFVVIWDTYPRDGSSSGVFGKRYDTVGQAIGDEFQVNTYTTSEQSWPSVAAGSDGAFVVAWVSWQDSSLRGVFAQRFGLRNDGCADATVISSLPFSDTVDVITATTDPSDPVRCDSSQGFNTVWYSYTPLTDTLLLIDPTDSMNYSPGVSIYTGACGALTEVRCTADAEKVLFAAQGGTTYLIEAAGGGATTPILVLSIEGLGCPPAPDPSCGAAAKALLLVKADKPGKEKLIAKLLNGPELSQTDFGNPLSAGGTEYALCLYDQSDSLAGGVPVDRAGDICFDKPCWKALGGAPPDGSGYSYADKARESFGVFKLLLKGGAAGSSKALLKGKGPTLPDGIPAALQSSTSVTMQLRASDAQCVSATLTDIKKQEAAFFKGKSAP